MNRRFLLGAASALGASGLMPTPRAAAAAIAAGAHLPAFELFYECDVTLAPIEDFGATIEGKRRIIPITGGSFRGPEIRGTVLPGGADWNLQRSDGGSSVEAAYYLRTDDGVPIRIVNTGVGGADRTQAADATELFFMYTHPVFEAPAGKYDWINRAMFIGTLGARKGASNAVLIRVYRLIQMPVQVSGCTVPAKL
jgi:hypothetical protein